ncbi:MAG: DegV family protein [Eggerthellaceae bacterium]|jgi:DegV family protein with EDD domain|nr:DegV family protein [Eggerthellaceae bacterium]MCH4220578.1 DegV family protein [Eggerthellaceae bacterium]
MAYCIVTDSSCNLAESYIRDHHIPILSLTLIADGTEYPSYSDGHFADAKHIYSLLRNGTKITTSLPSAQTIEETLEALIQDGKDILYIGFSHALSGTFEATNQALIHLQEKHPERKLLAVDTLAASGGEGLLVRYAIEMHEAGHSIDEVEQWVRDERFHLAHWFTVSDLMFLYRGGRLNKVSAYAGSILSIKPVLHMDDKGYLVPVSKVRTRNASIQAMFDHMCATVRQPISDQHVAITHGDCIEDAQRLQDMIEKRFQPKDISIEMVDPVIGAHSGPGTLALFFLASQR